VERTGTAHVLPDDIDTDQIIPGEYLTRVENSELGRYALVGYDEDFTDRITEGDIIVAGTNFGLGSSRESAPVALRNAGIGAVVAESFARIFYRNAINVGLPIVEVEDITDHVDNGDTVHVNIETGEVANESTGETFETTALSSDLLDILEAGGLIQHRLQQSNQSES
jgi:3-isopropylmalate/(R)-2-methylmalate dehydratase small subunit